MVLTHIKPARIGFEKRTFEGGRGGAACYGASWVRKGATETALLPTERMLHDYCYLPSTSSFFFASSFICLTVGL